MQIEDFEIAATAIEATTHPALWDTLCDKIAKRLGARAFMLQEYNVEAHTTPVLYASLLMRTGEGGRILNQVVAGNEAQTDDRIGYQALANTTAGTVIGEAKAFGFETMGPPSTNPFRDRILDATGATARSALRLNQIGPWMDVAITCDRQTGFGASKQLTECALNLSILLQKAIESKRLIARLTQSYTALLDLFDRLKFGVALCDSSGNTIVANEKLRHWLGEKDAIKNENNQIAAAAATCSVDFSSALKNSANFGPGSPPTTLSLARRSGEGSLVAHIAPVKDTTFRDNTSLLILVMDPAEERQIEADGLAAIAALTPAEIDVCNLLLRGLEVSSVCEHRGTGIETVRGQIKSIMQKLECRKRADLVRLAMVTSPNIHLNSQDRTL